MKTILSLFLLVSILFAAPPKQKQLTSPEETLKLLEPLKAYAVIIGTGKEEIHTFIDPLCSMSRRYLKFVFKNKRKMFDRYTIYLYLYELKRKNSTQYIKTILDSELAPIMLKSIMVNNEEIILEEVDDEEIDMALSQIDQTAKKIGVYKRPYIIVGGKAK
jgi:hypothetical protein